MMGTRKLIFPAVIVAGVLFLAKVVCAGEIDMLVNKLAEKGILTYGEAQQILTETKEDIRRQIAEGSLGTLPQWIQNIKMKGDFRLRYQFNHSQSTKDERHRGRVRVRLGVESTVNNKVMVALGLATGETDLSKRDAARSTNQSFADTFGKKPISLDYAYVKYSPFGWLDMYGGKMPRKPVIWEPTDLIWDGDINPEGGAFVLRKALNDKVKTSLSISAFAIDEGSSAGENDDPMMVVIQPYAEWKATDKIKVKGAFTYYNFLNVKGLDLPGSTDSNTKDGSNRLLYGYTPLSPAIEIGIKNPFGGLNLPVDIPYLKFFGEYVDNTQVSNSNTGYAGGLQFGSEKISGWGDWQFKYIYAQLEKDAIPDILPDSDRYGGRTALRSHEGIVTVGLSKNTSLGIDYYYNERIATKANQKPEHLLQVDWLFKF